MTGFAALTACAALLGQATRLVPENEGFVASFPGPVKYETKLVSSESSQLTAQVFSATVSGKLFQVTVTQLPATSLQSRSVKSILEAARDGTLTMSRMKVEAETDLDIAGSACKRFMVQVPDGPLMVHMLSIRREKLYHVLAVLPRESVLDGVNFVRSFSYVPPVPVEGG